MTTATPRTIKLYCPCLSKIVELVTWDEQRLDLGSIARTFGLDPTTLKLNGHFISRGLDFISSSVTWKSLISFFSARGLSTGAADSDALVVDGKLSRVGCKRSHDPADFENGAFTTVERADNCVTRTTQPEDAKLRNAKRLKDSNSAVTYGMKRTLTSCSSPSFKRKSLSEDGSSWKRMRSNNSDLVTRSNDIPGTIPNSQLPCSFISENTKRMREDEILLASPCKRIR